MSNNKIDQLFSNARDSEPYIPNRGFEEQLSRRLDQLDWPPVWLRFGLPLLGAITGLALAIWVMSGTGSLGYASQLALSIANTSFSLPIWSAGLISLFFTAAALLGAKKYL